jgi:hypothetical protein
VKGRHENFAANNFPFEWMTRRSYICPVLRSPLYILTFLKGPFV